MVDDLRPFRGGGERAGVAYIASLHLHIRSEVREPIDRTGGKIVQHPHPVARRNQMFDQV